MQSKAETQIYRLLQTCLSGDPRVYSITAERNEIRIIVQAHSDVESILTVLSENLDIEEATLWQEKELGPSASLVVMDRRHRAPESESPEELGQPTLSSVRVRMQLQTAVGRARDEVERLLAHGGPAARASRGLRNARLAHLELLAVIVQQSRLLLRRPNVHETRDVHPFLKLHSFLLHPNPRAVWHEVAIGLGTEYRIDFFIREHDGSYLLIELESPSHKLFTASGDFSSSLNHGLRQIEDWQDWIEDNIAVVQKVYPGIIAPRGLLVIGRTEGLRMEDLRRLRRRNINLRGQIEIRTYDDLIDGAEAFIEAVRSTI